MGVWMLGSSMVSMGTSDVNGAALGVEAGRCSPEGVSSGNGSSDEGTFGDWNGSRWIWKGSVEMSMVGNLVLGSSSLRLDEM